MYSRHRLAKFPQQVQTLLSRKQKIVPPNSIALLESAENFGHFERKDQPHSLNISEFIDPQKCSYFNARKLLFLNTLPEPTCWRVQNIAQTDTAVLQFSINLGEIDFQNISLSHIENLRTVW